MNFRWGGLMGRAKPSPSEPQVGGGSGALRGALERALGAAARAQHRGCRGARLDLGRAPGLAPSGAADAARQGGGAAEAPPSSTTFAR